MQNGKEVNTVKVVHYKDFGAVGDGVTDDLPAIARAHEYANLHGLSVRADDDASYYIGGRAQTALIQTDTDFGRARFIIDDRDLEAITSWVFEIRSALPPATVERLSSLKRNQKKLDCVFPCACLVVITDNSVRRYIRMGTNRNNGAPQTDIFLVDRESYVDSGTPIDLDFNQVTGVELYPVDDQPLTVRGGHFTSVANAAESKYTYYNRGIAVRRSNVVIDGLEHHVAKEGPHGAPYYGFIHIARCANVTVRNTVLTGRKKYWTTGVDGGPSPMGSYDLMIEKAVNVSIVNCRQTNDIHDRQYWGIMGSNYCRNLLYEECVLSRFDAHQGVVNATIRNSTLGHMGVLLIGAGTFLMENTTVHSTAFMTLRPDYGSTWRGDLVIRNCEWTPIDRGVVNLIRAKNIGRHDFGYTCHLPERIEIENLHIHDDDQPEDYRGPALFSDVNADWVDDGCEEKFPITRPQEVVLKNVTTTSGLPPRISDNTSFFKDVLLTFKC